LPCLVRQDDRTTLSFLGNNITRMTIGADVSFADKAFSGSDKFIETYSDAGSAAGTYVYEKGKWVKE
jgi:hypothetical protein